MALAHAEEAAHADDQRAHALALVDDQILDLADLLVLEVVNVGINEVLGRKIGRLGRVERELQGGRIDDAHARRGRARGLLRARRRLRRAGFVWASARTAQAAAPVATNRRSVISFSFVRHRPERHGQSSSSAGEAAVDAAFTQSPLATGAPARGSLLCSPAGASPDVDALSLRASVWRSFSSRSCSRPPARRAGEAQRGAAAARRQPEANFTLRHLLRRLHGGPVPARAFAGRRRRRHHRRRAYGCAESTFADTMPGPGTLFINVSKAINGCMLNALRSWGIPDPQQLARRAAPRRARPHRPHRRSPGRPRLLVLRHGGHTVVPAIVAARPRS